MDEINFTCLAVGIILMILGILMQFTKRNMFLGVRTQWSMKNETAWKRSQRFGGAAAVISGVVIIAGSYYLTGRMNQILFMLAIVLVFAAVCTVQSYFASKAD